MSSEMEAIDDDQWLYGDGVDEDPPLSKELLSNLENGRVKTPDLDEIEAASGLGVSSEPAVLINMMSNTTESTEEQSQDEEVGQDESETQVGPVSEETKQSQEEEEGDEGSDSDDDDDVKITIGEIMNTSSTGYGRTGYGRLPSLPGATAEGLVPAKKVDLDSVPLINGVPLPDLDLESIDKPWQKPGADITDYFNYGFTEETWKLYCDKQRKMRYESTQLSKFVGRPHPKATPLLYSQVNSMSGPTLPVTTPSLEMSMGLQQPMPTDYSQVLSAQSAPLLGTIQSQEDKEENLNADIKTEGTESTPPPDQHVPPPVPPIMPTKPPILPPPGMPPPHLPMLPPSSQDMAAAMAAAMFPPPPIRHEFPPGFPPPLPGTVPPFPPPMPGMPPPFGFPGDHPRGPPPMDERGQLLPPEVMGFPPSFPWDPSMGAPPPEMLEGYHRGGSRSPRSSSTSGHSSEPEETNKRHPRRERPKERSRDHRHHPRSRSRSRDRHRHRDYRDRERDRERERGRSERHEREKREHRRREERRHEKSRRHRSTSPDEGGSTHRSHKKRSSRSPRSPS